MKMSKGAPRIRKEHSTPRPNCMKRIALGQSKSEQDRSGFRLCVRISGAAFEHPRRQNGSAIRATARWNLDTRIPIKTCCDAQFAKALACKTRQDRIPV